MKSLAFLAAIMAVFLAVSAQAGEAVVSDSKTVAPAPPPPPELFGTGFYMGLVQTNILPTMLETPLRSLRTTRWAFTAESRQATSLAPGSFVRPLKETSFTTAGKEAGLALLEVLMGR